MAAANKVRIFPSRRCRSLDLRFSLSSCLDASRFKVLLQQYIGRQWHRETVSRQKLQSETTGGLSLHPVRLVDDSIYLCPRSDVYR